ncbi:MAG: hypothetical protein K9I34_07080, partial [Bacteroidales bacterium]|nr:hypothetical protein [Bacteroidales bacterium]
SIYSSRIASLSGFRFAQLIRPESLRTRDFASLNLFVPNRFALGISLRSIYSSRIASLSGFRFAQLIRREDL